MHYTGTIWRPPYEAYSVLVQVTAGCTHHKFVFPKTSKKIPKSFPKMNLGIFTSNLGTCKSCEIICYSLVA